MTRTRCPRDAWRRRRAICLQAHLAPPASTPREPLRTSPRRQGSVRGLRRVRNDTRTTAPPTLNACAGGNRLQRPCVAKAGKTAPLTALSRARRGATRAAWSVPDQPGPISGLPGYTVSLRPRSVCPESRKLMTGPRTPSAPPVRAAWPVSSTPQRLTFDRDRPTHTSHEHAATQHLDFTPSHPSEIPFIRPGLGPGGRGRAI